MSPVYILGFEQKLNEGRSLITIVNSRGPKVEPVEYHIPYYGNQIEPQRGTSLEFFRLYFRYCLTNVHSCNDYSHLHDIQQVNSFKGGFKYLIFFL